MNTNIRVKWRVKATVNKYDKDMNLIETIEVPNNILTTNGLARLVDVLNNVGGVAGLNDSGYIRLGVGDDATAEDPSDTDVGTTNSWYQTLDATYPQSSGGTFTFKATYGTSTANFTWASWGLDFDDLGSVTSSATVSELFNRRVFSFGTKTSGETWDLTAVCTLEG